MNLNKISVKQQGGQMIPNEPGMQQQPQVDPVIQQISVFFKESIEQGGKHEQVVMSLMQQEVDQNTIAQALMSLGYQEKDLQVLFQNIQQQEKPADPTAQQINQDPQQLARQQEIQEGQEGLNVNIDPIEMAKSGIEIKPENEGKFTAWAKARGMGVQEAAKKVMANKDRYPTRIVKMANFAKNAAGWKKEEGGEQKEFEPHFMYKGDRKIRAKDMETHLRLKEAGYTHDAPKAQTGNEMIDSAYQFANKNNITVKDSNDNILYGGQDVVNDNDDGIINNPFYISPSAFHTGKRFSPASLVNSVVDFGTTLFGGQDKDNDGLKDGSLRDLKNKTIANKAKKYADADYTVNLDLSDENVTNFQNWMTQYQKENPTLKDAISNLPTPNIETNKPEINNVVEEGKKWLSDNIGNLGSSAQGMYDALKNKISGTNPKKQFGNGESTSNEFDLANVFQNQTDYMADTQAVADSQLQQRFPDLGTTPLESQMQAENQQLVEESELDADALFNKINFGSVDVDTGGVFGALKRGYDSNAMRAFEDIAGKGIGVISNINDFMEDADDSGYVDARQNMVADNVYATKTDAQFKRGKGPDINTGLFGSDADRVTGYYMKNGGTNNPGFKALPKSVQANILQNMQGGGTPGQQIPGMPTKAQLDALTGANKIQFIPRTPQHEYLTSLAEQSVDFQLPNFVEDSPYNEMLVTRLFKESELMKLPSQSENFQLNNFEEMQMGGNPFNPLKLFTDELEEYQDKGETPSRPRRRRSDIEAEIAKLQEQINSENSRLEGFRSNIDKMYRGLLTANEAVYGDMTQEEKQEKLNKILGDSNLDRSLFEDTENTNVFGLNAVPSQSRQWLDSINGSGCTSFGCGIMRKAGATTADGSEFPIIAGNSELNSLIENDTKNKRTRGGLQMKVMPPGFSDLKPGDRIVSNYGTDRGDNAQHTMIFTGDYSEDGSPMMMENDGGIVDGGISYNSLINIKGHDDLNNPDSGFRVTRYMGSTDDLNNQLNTLQSDLEAGNYLREKLSATKLPQMRPSALNNFVDNIKVDLSSIPKPNKTSEYGGERGEAAYLANRDKIIKKEMAKAQQGGETINVDPKMLAKLIAAGADIEML